MYVPSVSETQHCRSQPTGFHWLHKEPSARRSNKRSTGRTAHISANILHWCYGSYHNGSCVTVHYEECRLLGYKNPVRTSQQTRYVSVTEFNRLMLCNIWGFHGRDYEECCLLGYKNPVRTSQETHYVSTTESSRLMLFKIWGFHGRDCEERRLLGYKNPVRTSQETHYICDTESSWLMLCKIWVFHSGDYEECHLVGRHVAWLL
jgi:hypothetical protein